MSWDGIVIVVIDDVALVILKSFAIEVQRSNRCPLGGVLAVITTDVPAT